MLAPSRVTKRSASSRKVQRSRPAGGALQASAIKCASFAPSSFAGRRGVGRFGYNAASSPSSTRARRTRAMVDPPTPKAARICASDQAGPPGPVSAWSKTQARRTVRAATRPCCVRASSRVRSSSVNVTWYLAGSPPGGRGSDARTVATCSQGSKVNLIPPSMPAHPCSLQAIRDRLLGEHAPRCPRGDPERLPSRRKAIRRHSRAALLAELLSARSSISKLAI
jgi:hypothetical protein